MPAADLHVALVRSPADERAFRSIPYALYRHDARWVPPLRAVERRRWSARHNSSLRTRWVRRFVASRGPTPMGRVAAIVDPAFASAWEPGAGLFGFFECAEDPETARALLEAAESALRQEGMTRVLGPVNLTTNDEVGLLVDGFTSRPMVLSPYNPPFYAALLAAAGYRPRLDYHAYAWTPATAAAPVVARVVRAATGRRGGDAVTVRPADAARWGAELRLLYDLYNACFADVWGFVPLAWEEFVERADSFKPFYRPDLALFAACGGRPVGFALALPDINEALAPLGGRLFPFGWWRLWRGIPRIRAARFLLLGVVREFRSRGVAVVLAAEMAAAARRGGVRCAELSLVQAGNRPVRAVIEACGGPRIKTYRLYEKPLDA